MLTKYQFPVQKVSPVFFVVFLGNTEINYEGENIQEVCTRALQKF